MPTEESLVRLSGDDIIELVRDRRNELIRKLLHADELNLYLKEAYNISEVSPIKQEFILAVADNVSLMVGRLRTHCYACVPPHFSIGFRWHLDGETNELFFNRLCPSRAHLDVGRAKTLRKPHYEDDP